MWCGRGAMGAVGTAGALPKHRNSPGMRVDSSCLLTICEGARAKPVEVERNRCARDVRHGPPRKVVQAGH
jgi:hypothetical protein